MSFSDIVFVIILMVLPVIVLSLTGIRKVYQHEEGLVIVLGNFKRILGPGTHFTVPLVSAVIKLDLRPQSLEIPSQEFITKDNYIINTNAVGIIRVIDSKKAFFEVRNYKLATVTEIQKKFISFFNNYTLKDIRIKKQKIQSGLLNDLNKKIYGWGMKLDSLTINDPVILAKGRRGEAEANKRKLIVRLRDSLNKRVDHLGIKIEEVEIKELG